MAGKEVGCTSAVGENSVEPEYFPIFLCEWRIYLDQIQATVERQTNTALVSLI